MKTPIIGIHVSKENIFDSAFEKKKRRIFSEHFWHVKRLLKSKYIQNIFISVFYSSVHHLKHCLIRDSLNRKKFHLCFRLKGIKFSISKSGFLSFENFSILWTFIRKINTITNSNKTIQSKVFNLSLACNFNSNQGKVKMHFISLFCLYS